MEAAARDSAGGLFDPPQDASRPKVTASDSTAVLFLIDVIAKSRQAQIVYVKVSEKETETMERLRQPEQFPPCAFAQL